ncbi:TIGR03085 family metal-binding protein [Cellulomonas sp.]|uniref:TIGR03085 family metal-binding protein n=1 Tax=Cellulomonas sp. TaxID=40001 RepID=UPI001B1EC724|nr:TIGR03085 family metal-binding protein [Cellulomonas sp.]MBO9554405.1 TIGR03085 family protein [Cellulomonas sp.]
MTWHQHERAALAQALSDVPPDAPTLCEGWEARHLAAHVVLREGSAVVGAGIVVPALADRAERAIQELGDSAATEGAYRDLVARVAAQPPGWHPMAWAGDAANLVELFVHTEDVRRGSGPVAPRPLEPELAEALWRQLVRSAPVRLRGAGVGIVLVRPDGVRRRVAKARGDHGTVVVRGDVGELLLHAFGRGRAADVTVEGAPRDLEALERRLPV